ncbi:transcription elongation factor S-II [Ordospora pajunii]|uniref:transcription elongation factor S-II n=1 Tax=Ordospora pajunii TaxID=3039483 RepID=UPI0029527D5F|nr:transcription elongation factor S-II [Ordospora pajunii]KAH9411678.1 transcription elongation factor S-II [Ordospora pajunii]
MDQTVDFEEIKRLINANNVEGLEIVLSKVQGMSAADLKKLIGLTESKKIQRLMKSKYAENRGDGAKAPAAGDAESAEDPCLILKEMSTGDLQKDRSIKMFFDAFRANIPECSSKSAALLARQITTEIFKKEAGEIAKLVRSKCLNLKDKNNPTLCRRVYEGEILPARYVEMSADEMKSESLRSEEVKMMEDSLYECQIPTQKAETDLFKCNRCGERKCSYRQLQTRSGDEPMTTFVTCECGNKWRFC